jgi:VWFA-related protein
MGAARPDPSRPRSRYGRAYSSIIRSIARRQTRQKPTLSAGKVNACGSPLRRQFVAGILYRDLRFFNCVRSETAAPIAPRTAQRILKIMRSTAAVALLALLCALPLPAQEIRAGEAITVERVVIDAYITDGLGNPVRNVTPANLRVWLDEIPATIDAVDWIGEEDSGRAIKPAHKVESIEEAERIVNASRGRLLVMFFQTDFARMRVTGQMRMMAYASKFLDTLQPDDRVAVVSFDSHLKFRQDFTRDREAIRAAIKQSILIDSPPRLEGDGEPSLAENIDPEEALKAATPETALLLVGRALEPIDGQKTMILFGWGLGTFGGGSVTMGRDYDPARRALESSRTSVFALDISDADYHTLEVGLGKIADDTGGFYAKTHQFTQGVMDRLTRTISGHYEIVVRWTMNQRGEHTIRVELQGVHGRIMTRQMFSD